MDNENMETINDKKEKKQGFFKRMPLPKKIILIILIIILLAVAAAGIALMVIRGRGEASLYNAENNETLQRIEREVQYNGKTYKYNDRLINILVMGIDSEKTVSTLRKEDAAREPDDLMWEGGAADALFLVTIDPDTKKVSVMQINRYSIAEILQPDIDGYIPVWQQICLAHDYGNGLEQSCGLQINATAKMLHNIGINGYISLNLPAIRRLNNVVGGVEVEVLEDIPPVAHRDYDYGIGDSLTGVVGQKITLNDNQAYAYMRYRIMAGADVASDPDSNTAALRVKRQKQYIKGWVKKALDMTKKDLFFPQKVMDALSDYLVTDVDSDEVIYMVTSLLGSDIDVENMDTLPGEIIQASKYTLGYRLNDEGVKELIIKKFYKEAK